MNNLKASRGRRKVSAAFRSILRPSPDVGLDDERKLFDVTRFELLVQLIERDARAADFARVASRNFALAELDDVARARFVRAWTDRLHRERPAIRELPRE